MDEILAEILTDEIFHRFALQPFGKSLIHYSKARDKCNALVAFTYIFQLWGLLTSVISLPIFFLFQHHRDGICQSLIGSYIAAPPHPTHSLKQNTTMIHKLIPTATLKNIKQVTEKFCIVGLELA